MLAELQEGKSAECALGSLNTDAQIVMLLWVGD